MYIVGTRKSGKSIVVDVNTKNKSTEGYEVRLYFGRRRIGTKKASSETRFVGAFGKHGPGNYKPVLRNQAGVVAKGLSTPIR